MGDLITEYLQYTSDTEVPQRYSRWCCIVGLGALLGRQYYLPFGHSRIVPNLYTMLIGSPGTRKGTAIKLIGKLLRLAGYHKFAAERSSKEKFLIELSGEARKNMSDDMVMEDILSKNIFGAIDPDSLPDAEMFISLDEFNDFIGTGNLDFISVLGNLWTWDGIYTSSFKNTELNINNPTISILAGNTPQGFKSCFPVEMIGQGFLSRLVIVYGEPNGRKITIPPTPAASDTARIVEHFRNVKSKILGPAKRTVKAELLLDKIYKSDPGISDIRFESYANRRLDQLIKMCLIVSASRLSTEITDNDVIHANTILSHAEQFMPKALGEFGRAKNSEVSHKVMEVINKSPGIVTLKEIWREVYSDLEDMRKLSEILSNLREADKIQSVAGIEGRKGGFLPKRKFISESMDWAIDYSMLTTEEKDMRL